MSDIADLAADREQEMRDDALAEHARKTGHEEGVESAEYCAICWSPINQGRRQALPGVQTCIDCQSDLEHVLERNTGKK